MKTQTLYQRLKPELKSTLNKDLEKYPSTLGDLKEKLKNSYQELEMTYYTFSCMRMYLNPEFNYTHEFFN